MNYIGCITVFLLVIIFELFSFLLTKLKFRSVKNYFKKEMRKIHITNSLIDLANEILENKGIIDEYPTLSKYLSQPKEILIKSPYNFDGFQVDLLKHISADNMEYISMEKLFHEYLLAPQSVKEFVNNLSDILGNIYSINHPWRYKHNMLRLKLNVSMNKIGIKLMNKKNFAVRILTISVRYLRTKTLFRIDPSQIIPYYNIFF